MMTPDQEVIARLYDVAEDGELGTLDDLMIRAGIIWRCDCGWNNQPEDDTCESCRLARQQEGQDDD